jgi:hypothetical protein
MTIKISLKIGYTKYRVIKSICVPDDYNAESYK